MSNVPYTFEAGKTAKSREVNINFESLYDDVNEYTGIVNNYVDRLEEVETNKANINGDANMPFNVGEATTATNAVNKGQVEKMISPLIDYISGLYLSKDGNNSVIVSKGSCYDTTHTVQIVLNENTSFTNASQVASSTYYVYLSVDDNGDNLQCLFTQDTNYPPYGVEKYRCIGRYSTNSSNQIDATTIVSYGTNQSGELSDNIVQQAFAAMLPNLSSGRSYSGGKKYTAPANGWLRWVCNENDTTQDLYIGQTSGSMVTVARVRAEASHDACGTAALVPIKAGWYFKSSKSTVYFYPIIGGVS